MALDRILAISALTLFAVFVGIIAVKVGRADLFIVCAIGLGMAGYDIWRRLFRGR